MTPQFLHTVGGHRVLVIKDLGNGLKSGMVEGWYLPVMWLNGVNHKDDNLNLPEYVI
jgi:hypothetical protein